MRSVTQSALCKQKRWLGHGKKPFGWGLDPVCPYSRAFCLLSPFEFGNYVAKSAQPTGEQNRPREPSKPTTVITGAQRVHHCDHGSSACPPLRSGYFKHQFSFSPSLAWPSTDLQPICKRRNTLEDVDIFKAETLPSKSKTM